MPRQAAKSCRTSCRSPEVLGVKTPAALWRREPFGMKARGNLLRRAAFATQGHQTIQQALAFAQLAEAVHGAEDFVLTREAAVPVNGDGPIPRHHPHWAHGCQKALLHLNLQKRAGRCLPSAASTTVAAIVHLWEPFKQPERLT
jgi:hypothetical protein